MNRPEPDQTPPPGQSGRSGHGLMMIACCVPMILIAIALVATGVVGFGFILTAFGCLAMMAIMMAMMGGGEQKRGERR
jgi:hypothetical protein